MVQEMNLQNRNTLTDMEIRPVAAKRGRLCMSDGPGVWGQQMRTITYRMDQQLGPTGQHRNYIQYPGINHNGKEYEKERIHTYNQITVLYSRNYHNTANQLYFKKIKFFKCPICQEEKHWQEWRCSFRDGRGRIREGHPSARKHSCTVKRPEKPSRK